jgi:hypothetical protein
MDTCIVLIYCLCDDLLKWQHHRDDPQCVLSDAEIMTIAIVAARYFGGNQALSREFLVEQATSAMRSAGAACVGGWHACAISS